MPAVTQQERGRRTLRRRWVVLLWLVTATTIGWYGLLTWKSGFSAGQLPHRLLPPPRPGDRVLLLAPHEDDEAIGAAVYMQQAAAVGATVYVCLLTNGEGEELGAAWTNRSLRLTARSYRRLGMVRQQETLRSVAKAGIPADHVFFLGYPNRGLDHMLGAACWDPEHAWYSPFLRTTTSPYLDSRTQDASFCGVDLLADLKGIMRELRPTVVLTCHPADIHRDHWPAYGFARLALDALAEEPDGVWAPATPVYTYLVHRVGWPVPYGYAPDEPLAPPPALEELPANQWLELPADPPQRERKRRMLATYRSQASAYDLLIRSFVRTNELFATLAPTPLTENEIEPMGNEAEPVGDLKALRREPGADLALVQCHLQVHTVGLRLLLADVPNARTGFTVMVNLAQPAPDRVQALQVDCSLGREATVTAASARGRFAPAVAGEAHGTVAGRTILVSFPRPWLHGCRSFNVVGISRQGHHVLDHTLIRTYRLSPAQPPAP